MKRMLCSLLLGLSVGTASLMSCDCGLLPVCAYRDADIIFLGRVSFTNHDYAVGLNQATLVRFEVEEAFKGIAPDAHQIWVDPGSFTSCYEVYKPGNRYLIFGTLLPTVPQQTAAITIAPRDSSKAKPLPPGFSPSTPPPIYYSPECAGSRNANGTPGFEQDLAMLREYRAGVPLPRVLGHVHMSPYSGWPYLDGPALAGAEITISKCRGGTQNNNGCDGQVLVSRCASWGLHSPSYPRSLSNQPGCGAVLSDRLGERAVACSGSRLRLYGD